MFIFCFSKIAGEEDDVNLKRSNEEGGPWKLAKYVTGKVNWTSACQLNITCYRGAFRHQSKCKCASVRTASSKLKNYLQMRIMVGRHQKGQGDVGVNKVPLIQRCIVRKGGRKAIKMKEEYLKHVDTIL